MLRKNFIFVAMLLGATATLPSTINAAASPKADAKSPKASFKDQKAALRDRYFDDCGIREQTFDATVTAVDKAVKAKWKKATTITDRDEKTFVGLFSIVSTNAYFNAMHANGPKALAFVFKSLQGKQTRNSVKLHEHIILAFFRGLLLAADATLDAQIASAQAAEKAAAQAEANAAKAAMQVAAADAPAGADGGYIDAVVAAVVAGGSNADVAAVGAQLAAMQLGDDKQSAAAPAEQPATPPASASNPRQLSSVANDDSAWASRFDATGAANDTDFGGAFDLNDEGALAYRAAKSASPRKRDIWNALLVGGVSAK